MAETVTEAGQRAGREMEEVAKLLDGRWDMTVTYEPNDMLPQGGTFKDRK